MKGKYWIIERYESNQLIKEHKIPFGLMTEKQVENLLKTLTAKYSLNDEETINSYLKRNTQRYTGFLEIQRSWPPYEVSCGDNPHFIAKVVDEEKPVTIPPNLDKSRNRRFDTLPLHHR